MKLASLRIATEDVSRLAEFYAMLTQTEPVGNLDYVEFRTTGAVLAICSMLFRDPDGHLINFFSPINAETTEFDMRGYAADSVQQPAIKNATTF